MINQPILRQNLLDKWPHMIITGELIIHSYMLSCALITCLCLSYDCHNQEWPLLHWLNIKLFYWSYLKNVKWCWRYWKNKYWNKHNPWHGKWFEIVLMPEWLALRLGLIEHKGGNNSWASTYCLHNIHKLNKWIGDCSQRRIPCDEIQRKRSAIILGDQTIRLNKYSVLLVTIVVASNVLLVTNHICVVQSRYKTWTHRENEQLWYGVNTDKLYSIVYGWWAMG